MAEPFLDMLKSVFVVSRNGKQQGSEPAIDIESQADEDERHTQRMIPYPLAAAERAIAIDRLGKFGSATDPLGFVWRKAGAKRLQGMFDAALGGDGMDDGNHVAIISPSAAPFSRRP